VLLSTSTLFNSQYFFLEKGGKLDDLQVAYETYGTLNETGNNGILVCHGYTNNQHAAGDESGWYSGLIGPGKAVDTKRYYVIAANMLGSSYGSTGPASINPANGKPYGLDFPDITINDMVNSQIRLLNHLGVNQLVAVIGNSFGGHLTFQWGVAHPDRTRTLVAVVSAPKGTGDQNSVGVLLDRFSKCPGWNNGQYYGNEVESGILDELLKFRIKMLKNYGWDNKIREDFGDNPEIIDQYLTSLAKPWAKQFDANSLIILRKASIQFDVRSKSSNIRAPLLYVLSRTDNLFPPSIAPKIMKMFKKAGVDAHFVEINSDNGHRASSIDWRKWERDLKKILEKQSGLL
jgi:homoserine O-acetyltransferase